MPSLPTTHGALPLPAFLPDATRGVVRTVDGADLRAVGIDAVCVNTWHLAKEPGARAIEKLGGIHRFMGFDGPVLSDSGGFQVLSLLASGALDGSASNKGIRWRAKGGDAELLTPEKCIRWQAKLGADLLVCLDHCTRPEEPPESQRTSVEHTVRWAEECKATRDRIAEESGIRRPLLAVIQGGDDPALRRECATRLFELGFDGYAFGGWPVRSDGTLVESVALVAELVARGSGLMQRAQAAEDPAPPLPLWGLGLGKPENVVAAAALGYSLFDCVLPTRDARQGRICVRLGGPARADNSPRWWDYLYLADTKHAVDDAPLEPGCPCPTCARCSRGYLHHLATVNESLVLRLATLHNLSFYARLMRELQAARAAATERESATP
ncbi:MAG: queuine tRNA-ribosyltransferase family protein [Planctomycetes bacterium]|nr:queuine tRNA-ribosyltransferase family protein [Planctomycetota bacterium]